MKQKNGYTFIEFLVSIALILILTAILYPVFKRANENYQKSQQTELRK